MSPKGAEILANPHPRGHIVYPYKDENLVAEAVSLFACSGLRNGEAVILIMSAAHCNPINRRIAAEGFDIAALQRTGQLSYIVAEDLLSGLMAGDEPNEVLFKTVTDRVIRNAKASTGQSGSRVRIFGEMVSLLRGTNLRATARLEELWNQVIEDHSVSLMCTYALDGSRDDTLPQSLVSLHSHSLPLAG